MEQHEDKFIFGVVKIGDKGQIVIPKDARKHYNLKPGDSLMIIGNSHGMAMLNPEIFYDLVGKAMEGLSK